MKKVIAPSLLAADMGRLDEEVASVEKCADVIHFDVMDGHFVHNLALGVGDVRAVETSLPKWVHLMIEAPESFVGRFIEAGADWITFHAEATANVESLLEDLRGRGVRAGLALRPGTSFAEVEKYMPDMDHVLVMLVEPGFGGQKMMPEMLGKVREIREKYPDFDICVDGGINEETIAEVSAVGANVFVAGSAVFGKEDRCEACKKLRDLASGVEGERTEKRLN